MYRQQNWSEWFWYIKEIRNILNTSQMTQNPEYPIVREQLPQWKELSVLSPVISKDSVNILATKSK